MTNTGDVIRQIEALRRDRQYPPTAKQQETMNKILFNVHSGIAESRGGE